MLFKKTFLVLVIGLASGSVLSTERAFGSQTSGNFSIGAVSAATKDKHGKEKHEKKESEPETIERPAKYLVGDPISVSALGALPKTFDLRICSGTSGQGECAKLDKPPSINSIFNVQAIDQNDRPLRFSVKALSGKAEVYPYDNTLAAVRIHPRMPGKLVLEATSSTSGSSPLRVTLYVAGDAGSELSSCARLFPPVVQRPPAITASMIVSLIGLPDPYLLEDHADKILIYSTQPPQEDPKKIRRRILETITQQIKKLSGFVPADLGLKQKSEFTVELTVPHASAFSDLGARVASLNNSQFAITRVGSDKIRVTSAEQPSCEVWSGFLSELRHTFWGIYPEPPAARLFYQNAPDVTEVLNANGGKQTEESPPPPTAAGATPGKKSDTPAPKSTASVRALNDDLLVFNSINPGDDADVAEKKRIIALLDFPRPEMIINAWMMQNSSKDATLVSGFSDIVARTVSSFNNALEDSITRAWGYLSNRINSTNYFNDEFYRYIALRHIGELPYAAGLPGADHGAQEVLELRSERHLDSEERKSYHACGPHEYCLGYGGLFHPLRPRMTDLLLTIIAAESPVQAAAGAINAIEKSARDHCDPGQPDYCEKIRSRLGIRAEIPETEDCRRRDLAKIHKTAGYNSSPILQLQCFRDKAKSVFGITSGTNSQVGVLRAAIADFLFNYKMSQQYPHEFLSYELSQSADTLNAALSPFVEAFNQDLKAFHEYLQEELRYRVEKLSGSGWLFGKSKQSFINNGTVSVRTISGEEAIVDTTSQSFLDASSLPQFADLAKSILEQNPPKGANGNPTGVLGNLSFNQAQVILGALQAFKPTSVQIGRSLSLKVNPRTLSAGSAAEIDVVLAANETAPPTYYGGPKDAQPPNTSRVAKHDTSTRVRVDSLKLFEVSSFSAELQRSRSRFPLLPPFVEIPYIGTLIGFPLPPAKQYHTSTAVMSAVVVPTAADLAYGLAFTGDRILEANGTLRRAVSIKDLHQPIRIFNKYKVSCFVRLQALTDKCPTLSFQDVWRDSN